MTGLSKTPCRGLAGLGRVFDLRPKGVKVALVFEGMLGDG